ncbi:rap guanine nucleotide exchange factor 1 isoform X6 [Denticeps clupeoides]|uniref:CRK SH3-binding GNRP n=1 Tax=Denticeps clupeoides TaxID=299321 RepID=A0AAY4CNZ7_9TELE|nr:rap guanine nucleotide exchange factor 1 isoform X6 [Denticeps clupeoides]
MSGKIESKQDSQRSHFSSLTLKLMDKFHSPKIKRTPSKKTSKRPSEPSVKTTEKPVNKNLTRLEEHEKDVVSALRYFKTIIDKMTVDRKVLEMLPGSASKVLEAILPLVQVDPRIQHSSAVSSCLNRVYQSLGNLIRWSDQVMLGDEGINLEDKETIGTVTTVIKAVLDGVKELVKLTIEKQEHPSPTSPVKAEPSVAVSESTPVPAAEESEERRERESETLSNSPTKAQSTEVLTDMADEEVAPPKPPLPGLKVPEHCAQSMANTPANSERMLSLQEAPPALPPKKRQSAPSPTRVAVVAPMSRTTSGSSLPIGVGKPDYEADAYQRRFSGGSHSYGGESPRLSPCSSMGKLSKSDEQLSSLDQDSGQCSRNTSCETLDVESYDPDYDFLHQDLSSVEQIPPLPMGGCLSPLPESHRESSSPFPLQLPPPNSYGSQSPPRPLHCCAPPALPEKKRRSGTTHSAISSASFDGVGSRAPFERLPSQYDNICEEDLQPVPPFPVFPISPMPGYASQFIESADLPQSPPPLPEKKSRNILKYMQFVEDYSEPQPSVFYQTPQSESIYEQRNKRFQEVYGFNDSFSSSDSVHDPLPPPALPPKQRQLDPSSGMEDTQDPGSDNSKDVSDESWRQKSPDSGQSTDEVDELSLIDHDEIMSRITLKAENDDGPDVRAGSGDILLVHATETDRKDLVLYCEAFLTTYRTFMTPEELIKKLHYRYTRFSHSPDTFKKRVSKNTFFVLVRVVDELCLVELTDDILKQLMDLVFRLVCNGELSLARVLRKNILDKVEQKKLMRYTTSLQPLAARGVAARPGTLHDFRSHEIADQLTLLDAELFYKIEIPEVLLWAKEQNEEKSPNLTQFTEHFNNMSYWVRSIIILQEKAQDREKLLLKFIKIMKHLRKLNNFNSYLAILSALDSAPIRRLEWQKQTSEGLEEYCTLIDSSSSFRAYRAALAEVEPPCIPYLGLILQDLTFVHLGNPDLIDGKVNFSKRWQQFNILDSMRRFQQVHYELKHNEDIVSFFNDFSDHLAEEALWELSLKIKPRNIVRRKTEREEKT